MKFLNKKQKNNKGFSLVELIVVIAIMVVLVAVLAPVFTKYIESSRRSTDVQNANAIAEGVLADVADGKIKTPDTNTDVSAEVKDDETAGGTNVSAIAKAPVTKGDAVGTDKTFTYTYHPKSNTCDVFVTGDSTYNLATEAGATAYKNAD